MNKNSRLNGDYMVHVITCNRLPLIQNKLSLGYYDHYSTALAQAKKFDPEAEVCVCCLRALHKTPVSDLNNGHHTNQQARGMREFHHREQCFYV